MSKKNKELGKTDEAKEIPEITPADQAGQSPADMPDTAESDTPAAPDQPEAADSSDSAEKKEDTPPDTLPVRKGRIIDGGRRGQVVDIVGETERGYIFRMGGVLITYPKEWIELL